MAEANPESVSDPAATIGPNSENSNKNNTGSTNSEAGAFECNICFDLAKEPVVTICGHLYCWPCIYQWIAHKQHNPTCPVCKGVISREQLTPIFGKTTNQSDPRKETPPRPTGNREEPPQQPPNQGFFGMQNEWSFHLGIGAFPFGLFTNINNFRPHGAPPTEAMEQERKLSKYFVYLAIIFTLWLLF